MMSPSPIRYRDYLIYLADDNPTPFNYAYYHEDYDGEGDPRYGVSVTLEDARIEIDCALDASEDGEEAAG